VYLVAVDAVASVSVNRLEEDAHVLTLLLLVEVDGHTQKLCDQRVLDNGRVQVVLGDLSHARASVLGKI